MLNFKDIAVLGVIVAVIAAIVLWAHNKAEREWRSRIFFTQGDDHRSISGSDYLSHYWKGNTLVLRTRRGEIVCDADNSKHVESVIIEKQREGLIRK